MTSLILFLQQNMFLLLANFCIKFIPGRAHWRQDPRTWGEGESSTVGDDERGETDQVKAAFLNNFSCWMGLHSTELAYLLLTQQPWVWFPALPKKISVEKWSMLLRWINSTDKMKVGSGLKMLNKPIYLVLASKQARNEKKPVTIETLLLGVHLWKLWERVWR